MEVKVGLMTVKFPFYTKMPAYGDRYWYSSRKWASNTVMVNALTFWLLMDWIAEKFVTVGGFATFPIISPLVFADNIFIGLFCNGASGRVSTTFLWGRVTSLFGVNLCLNKPACWVMFRLANFSRSPSSLYHDLNAKSFVTPPTK